ncbi:MAG: substrate-binding domain-containing protein [Anaerolineae bacterium]
MIERARTMLATGLVILLQAVGCVSPSSRPADKHVLRLATTTSTYDSGLLNAILPQFEAEFGVRVDVVAVGTGQALAIGANGDADVVLVHDRAREEQFVSDGHAPARYDVMYNDFVIVGPPEDRAGIRGSQTAAEAFKKITDAGALFASRGDESGTHTREREIWTGTGLEPGPDNGWYNSLGQGMGDTLVFANEQHAYTLSDRSTFLSMRNRLPDLTILVGGDSIANNPDPGLYNPYSVMPINPETHFGVNYDLAITFVEWLTSAPVQARIAEFGVATFGQPLFFPKLSVQ